MKNDLTPQEIINLESFSNPYAVEKVYNKEGLTVSEQKIIEKYFVHEGRVLDLGCGTGRTTFPLQQKGHDVIGIDLSKEMIDFARTKHPGVDFRVMNACELQFENESFDYVLFSFNGLDCIFPYQKRLACLQEIHRVLKKGGLFVFSSHNALCLPKNRDMLGTFIRNVFNLRILSRYREEISPNGKWVFYYGIPMKEKVVLQKMGFQTLEIKSARYVKAWQILFQDLSPHYVARKL
jgi:ubiquinone/menaquinone biosynthesis C-methylase UbiE